MTRIRWVITTLLIALPAGAQIAGEPPDQPVPAPPGPPEPVREELGEEQVPTMISMVAYREVLASGRYLVGPGDGFLLHLTGMDAPYFSQVMAEGGLFVPQVGMVTVAGESLERVRAAVERAYHRAFQEGEIAIQLSTLREFSVPIVGVVARPGRYVASGVVRIGELVGMAGAVGNTGSRRNIRVVKTAALDPVI